MQAQFTEKPHILTDEEAMDCVLASALGMSYEELKKDMEVTSEKQNTR